MVKAWLIVFLFWHSPNEFSLEEEKFAGKIEIPFSSMAACSRAKTDLSFESEDVRYQFVCVTDDHHAGRSVDPGVPLD